jgi:hypothetical protein
MVSSPSNGVMEPNRWPAPTQSREVERHLVLTTRRKNCRSGSFCLFPSVIRAVNDVRRPLIFPHALLSASVAAPSVPQPLCVSGAWPAYIANLRARHRCPVCLLVVTTDDAVARWAQRTIELGPGTRCQPWIVGPSNAPAVTDVRNAKENVELAVLSAVEHGRSKDIPLVLRITSAALQASATLDAERSELYFDLIMASLSEEARKAIEDTMRPPGFEYQSDFARRYFFQGKEEGRTEGRLELTLQLLELRFGPMSEETQTRVRCARDAQLDAVAGGMLTARTLEEALVPLG